VNSGLPHITLLSLSAREWEQNFSGYLLLKMPAPS